jgi:hypothetical protein
MGLKRNSELTKSSNHMLFCNMHREGVFAAAIVSCSKATIPCIECSTSRGRCCTGASGRREMDRQLFEIYDFYNKYRLDDPLGTISAFIVTVESSIFSRATASGRVLQ